MTPHFFRVNLPKLSAIARDSRFVNLFPVLLFLGAVSADKSLFPPFYC
ncbi:hypothetical protein AVDCRST_MAG84-3090 [uncultured Microcoleus sp.]|uniref:Uncharacterized protein n=1 Tax=uncultured Microcoleus sp. TaxID=259945 RepID=A0A6J4MDX7_9CYAN|nr:hypothetical protein AVDCRST_MAG84-3090 [uncultured Microcoleus sp.]